MMTAIASLAWRVATSRIGIAAIAAAISWNVAYHRGYSRADRQAEIAALESRIAVKEADLTAARNAERVAKAQAEQLADISLKQQEYLNDLESELSARPDRASCRVTDDDARRLRGIDAGEGGGAPRSSPIPLLGDPGRGAATTGR